MLFVNYFKKLKGAANAVINRFFALTVRLHSRELF